MPALFRDLLDQPLRPLTRARLPDRSAVYLFYDGEEPIGVGSPPHLPEIRMLAPSVRLSLAVSVKSDIDRSQVKVGPLRDSGPSSRPPLAARWLSLDDDEDRMLLELYAAQSLGLSVTHPRIRAGLG